MLYALRKLIAFVFLGGIFWFIYQDLGNLEKPWFMHALGVLVLSFALFWLLIPMLVVRLRIRRRQVQNRAGYDRWKSEHAGQSPQPFDRKNGHLALEADERVFFHEKGTLYVGGKAGFDEMSVKGRPGDIAFPGYHKLDRKIQRTHGYFTDRRILLVGKAVNCSIPFADLVSVQETPGGLVLDTTRDGRKVRLAFTFQNPLIAAEVLRSLNK